jgi:hypothetical protein
MSRYTRRGFARRAAKVDANQRELVDALHALPGVKCIDIGRPVDLLIGVSGNYYRDGVARTFLVEVKNPKGKNKLEPDQEAFMTEWPGEVHVCRSLADVITAIGIDPGRV